VRGSHIDSLDGWRGLAIGALLIGHFVPIPGINLGSMGVDLFFVLSGWLMTRLLFLQEMPIVTFYRRRIARIFPVYYVFIAFMVGLFAWLSMPIAWLQVTASALFFKNYVAADAGLPFGHLWSLCVEEHSYVVLSLVAVAARRRWLDSRQAMAILVLACALFSIWYWTQDSARELEFGKRYHSEVAAYGIFMSGLLLLHFRERGVLGQRALVCPLLLLLGVALHWWSVPFPVRQIAGVGAFALAINLLPTSAASLRKALSIAPLRQLGLWSYSIYVWQQVFYDYGQNLGLPPSMSMAAAIATGATSYYVLERPVRRYLNRVWGRVPDEPASAAPQHA
jgi:peptidoglycan/LPS O-acetylase OafA/YrhL